MGCNRLQLPAVRPGATGAGRAAGSTRDRLIEAAGDVIAEEGYDRAGTQEIARRAGLTNGAIYANFRDKSELLAEAIEVHLARLFGTMEHARRAGLLHLNLLKMLALGRIIVICIGPPRVRRTGICQMASPTC